MYLVRSMVMRLVTNTASITANQSCGARGQKAGSWSVSTAFTALVAATLAAAACAARGWSSWACKSAKRCWSASKSTPPSAILKKTGTKNTKKYDWLSASQKLPDSGYYG